METATWARRILALLVDWFASTLVVIVLVGGVDGWAGDQQASLYVLGVFTFPVEILYAQSELNRLWRTTPERLAAVPAT